MASPTAAIPRPRLSVHVTDPRAIAPDKPQTPTTPPHDGGPGHAGPTAGGRSGDATPARRACRRASRRHAGAPPSDASGTGRDPQSTVIDFGTVRAGTTVSCRIRLTNTSRVHPRRSVQPLPWPVPVTKLEGGARPGFMPWVGCAGTGYENATSWEPKGTRSSCSAMAIPTSGQLPQELA